MQKETFKIFGVPVYSRSVQVTHIDEATQVTKASVYGSGSSTGIVVDNDTPTTISAVWRAVDVVSSVLAFLPVHVFKKEEDNNREYLSNHPVQQMLNDPHPDTNDFIFRQTMQALKMLWGNAYAVIKRNPATGLAEELIPVHPSLVEPMKTDFGVLYQLRLEKGQVNIVAKDMIHLRGLGFDGLKGKSVIQVQRESIGLTKAAEVFGAKFFGNGANMSGVLEFPSTLTEPVYNRIKESWSAAYHGFGNSHNTAILEAGAKYQRIGIPPNDAQFLETRKFQLSEVARWFGVQPHLLMDLERSTNNNIEQQSIEFVIYTLAGQIKNWERELKKKLFRKELQSTHYIEFNINALMRADAKSRSEFYKGMFGVGALNPNGIRKLENDSPYEGGDNYYVQAGYVPVHLIEEVYKKKFNRNEKPETAPQ